MSIEGIETCTLGNSALSARETSLPGLPISWGWDTHICWWQPGADKPADLVTSTVIVIDPWRLIIDRTRQDTDLDIQRERERRGDRTEQEAARSGSKWTSAAHNDRQSCNIQSFWVSSHVRPITTRFSVAAPPTGRRLLVVNGKSVRSSDVMRLSPMIKRFRPIMHVLCIT